MSDNSQGADVAWPAFVITDQPVPAPNNDTLSGTADQARNSVGVDFDQVINSGACLGATVWETANYQTIPVTTNNHGCFNASRGVGDMNHVEIQINSTSVHVYVSQPGDPSSTKLMSDAEFAVPLSQGVVWLEDVHYNVDKFNTQQTNTFSWSDLAFDGPVEPRDLGFDVLDSTVPGGTAENGLPLTNLGYPIRPGGGTLTLSVPNVTGVANATGALLTMTYWPQNAQTITYSLNGNPPLQFAWPYGNSGTYQSESVAMPIPLSEIVAGTNTVTLSTSDTGNGVNTANFDLSSKAPAGQSP